MRMYKKRLHLQTIRHLTSSMPLAGPWAVGFTAGLTPRFTQPVIPGLNQRVIPTVTTGIALGISLRFTPGVNPALYP
jgi:hypothetical protein